MKDSLFDCTLFQQMRRANRRGVNECAFVFIAAEVSAIALDYAERDNRKRLRRTIDSAYNWAADPNKQNARKAEKASTKARNIETTIPHSRDAASFAADTVVSAQEKIEVKEWASQSPECAEEYIEGLVTDVTLTIISVAMALLEWKDNTHWTVDRLRESMMNDNNCELKAFWNKASKIVNDAFKRKSYTK